MIILSLGNPGSGKTASIVREMAMEASGRKSYSNIITKRIKSNSIINPEMIVSKNIVKTIKKKSGEMEPVYELKLNVDFWKSINEPIDVIIDEAHSIINARRAMSKVNVIMSDWLALIRRVIGQSDSGYGRLVLISQLLRRIDPIARDMATQVRFHRCHYMKTCRECYMMWRENSDNPEPIWQCPGCGSFKIKKHSHKVEVWHFPDVKAYEAWAEFGMSSFHRHYIINDIEDFFPMYNTLQWDNMFSELY